MDLNKTDLNKTVDRRRTNSFKWDDAERLFGRSDLLPFWVADMDFETPAPILEAIRKRLEHPVLGYERRSEEYIAAVRHWLSTRHDWDVPAEWLVFCPPSSIVGMYGLVTELTAPGESVVLQTPTYGPLYNIVGNSGRTQILSPLKETDGFFEFAVDDVEARLLPDTRLVLICSPHNPTGRVFTEAELAALAELAEKHNLIVISDEVHCDLIMPGNVHIPYGKMGGERSVTVISPNKTFNTAGIPQATLIIPDEGIRRKFQSFGDTLQINQDPTFGAVGMVAGYRFCADWLDEVIAYVAENHQILGNYLREHIPMLRMTEAQATYLAWLDCRDTGFTDAEIMERLVNRGGIGLYAGTEFGAAGEGFLRMNVACPRSTLEKGLEGLKKAFT
jgi:cystathionine beta-lyase